jgi:hypothetical protein
MMARRRGKESSGELSRTKAASLVFAEFIRCQYGEAI